MENFEKISKQQHTSLVADISDENSRQHPRIQLGIAVGSSLLFLRLLSQVIRRKVIPPVPIDVLAHAMPKKRAAKAVINGSTATKPTTTKKEKIPEHVQQFIEQDAKVAAYLFAGKAFGVATLLVTSFVVAIGFGSTYALGIHSFEGSTSRLRSYLREHFPKLAVDATYDDVADEKEIKEVSDILVSELLVAGDGQEGLELLGSSMNGGMISNSVELDNKSSSEQAIGPVVKGYLRSLGLGR